MKKGLFQVLMFCATLLLTAQLSAQSFPSVAPAPGTTTYSALPALPASWYNSGTGWVIYSYTPTGDVSFTLFGQPYETTPAGGMTFGPSGFYDVPTAAAPALPSGYTYTTTGQILTPSGQTVSSFSTNPSVPFDGGMSIVLLASGIGYGAKRLKAKKAAKATATAA